MKQNIFKLEISFMGVFVEESDCLLLGLQEIAIESLLDDPTIEEVLTDLIDDLYKAKYYVLDSAMDEEFGTIYCVFE